MNRRRGKTPETGADLFLENSGEVELLGGGISAERPVERREAKSHGQSFWAGTSLIPFLLASLGSQGSSHVLALCACALGGATSPMQTCPGFWYSARAETREKPRPIELRPAQWV